MSPREFMPYKRRIQIIFQNPYASLNPRFTVGQILTEPMQIHGIGESTQERTELAFELLAKVGLPEVSFYKYPHEFSGGQRQRIAIARCLTLKPDILICDESVSALDVSVQAQVLNLLQDLQDEFGLSYIFISHDLAVVKYISDQVMVMNQGELVEMADSDEIYRAPKAPYTQKLLSAIPRGGTCRRGGRRRLSLVRRPRAGGDPACSLPDRRESRCGPRLRGDDRNSLQRERHLRDQRARKPHARQLPRAVALRRQHELGLVGQVDEMRAEHPVQRIVEAHHVDRRDDLPALDPERREARHAGHPARGAIGVVHVPEVADVEAGVERGERVASPSARRLPSPALPAIPRRSRRSRRCRTRARSAG